MDGPCNLLPFCFPSQTAAWTSITPELLVSLLSTAIVSADDGSDADASRTQLIVETVTFLIQRLFVMDENHVSGPVFWVFSSRGRAVHPFVPPPKAPMVGPQVDAPSPSARNTGVWPEAPGQSTSPPVLCRAPRGVPVSVQLVSWMAPAAANWCWRHLSGVLNTRP